MIYRLTDQDVGQALDGPPCELLAESEMRIPEEFADPQPAPTEPAASPEAKR